MFAILSAGLAAAVVLASKTPPPLECRLTAPASAPAGGPLLVRFTLKNRSSRPLSVLTWQTPLEGLLGDVFRVIPLGGEALPYLGPMVKRKAPEGEEYVRLAPGGEASEEVDLAAAYELTPGRYSVSFVGRILDVASPAEAPRPPGRHRPVSVSCRPLEIEIHSRPEGQSR